MSPQDQQRRARPQERAKEQSRSAPPSQPRTADQPAVQEASATQKGQSDMALEEAQVTAGKDGARNIRIQWIDVHLPNAKPCRFAITTAPGNSLEALMEQKSY